MDRIFLYAIRIDLIYMPCHAMPLGEDDSDYFEYVEELEGASKTSRSCCFAMWSCVS